MKRRDRRHYRGFTLVESLAALLLVGVVLPVAMRGITGALQTTSAADRTAEAVELCRSKLAETSVAIDTSTFTGSGQFAENPAFSWSSGYTTRDDGTDELTCTVTWQQGSAERDIALTTLVYVAAATDAATVEAQ